MVRDVPASTRSRVELIDRAPKPNSRTPKPSGQGPSAIGSEIGEDYVEHIVDRAAERDQAAVHIGFPER